MGKVNKKSSQGWRCKGNLKHSSLVVHGRSIPPKQPPNPNPNPNYEPPIDGSAVKVHVKKIRACSGNWSVHSSSRQFGIKSSEKSNLLMNKEDKKMPRKEHHVVPNSERGGWDVKKNNASRASGHYDTKEKAMEAGRRMSQNQGTELIPHRKDGRIQNPDSHGNDPCPPKDKNK